ncbi:MAG: hypothetical protein ACRDK0_00765, partial [Solirubrobacteraceae bacterium]
AGVADDADVLLVMGDPRESLAAAADSFAGVLTNEPPRRPLARAPHFAAGELHRVRPEALS